MVATTDEVVGLYEVIGGVSRIIPELVVEATSDAHMN
jgi:hypothetical protein